MEKQGECLPCQHCGAEIKTESDKECPGCHKDVKECIVDKSATSSVYPM